MIDNLPWSTLVLFAVGLVPMAALFLFLKPKPPPKGNSTLATGEELRETVESFFEKESAICGPSRRFPRHISVESGQASKHDETFVQGLDLGVHSDPISNKCFRESSDKDVGCSDAQVNCPSNRLYRSVLFVKCAVCGNLEYCVNRDGACICKRCYSERFADINSWSGCIQCGKELLSPEENDHRLCGACKERVDAVAVKSQKMSDFLKVKRDNFVNKKEVSWRPQVIYINPAEIEWVNPINKPREILPPGYYVKRSQQSSTSEPSEMSCQEIDCEKLLNNWEEAGYMENPFASSIGTSLFPTTAHISGPSPNNGFRNDSRNISRAAQREVWRRDCGKCAFCGSKELLEYDHIVPYSRGGKSTVRNLQLLCRECNRRKSNKM